MSIWKDHRAKLFVTMTALLLLVLAVLQYRWVGELSEFEYQQKQRALDASTDGFVRDLEREFRRIREAFEIRRMRDLEERLVQEYAEWVDESEYPDLIADMYWADRIPALEDTAETAATRIRQLNLREGLLSGSDPPPMLTPLLQTFPELPAYVARNRFRGPRALLQSLDDNHFALVIPQEDRRNPSWAVILLTRHVLVDQLIPSIVEKNFGTREEREYNIWMVEDNPKSEIVYASDAGIPFPGLEKPDIQRDISGSGVDWIVAASHGIGSLDAYVRQYRWRNLSLGIGTVLVLGASFIFLTLATRRAQWLAERQMEFVAGVSHELRTPLAGISSLSQNLADGVVDDLDQAARYGETINNESRRLNEMIEKVLQFSAIRTGQYHFDPQPVDLQAIIQRELEAFRRFSGGKAKLEEEIDDDLPLVIGDEQGLRTVVRNLISNAMKFGSESSPVSVSAHHVEAGGSERSSEIELRVEDHGPGIAQSELPHIFDPFYRGQGARAAQVRGSGLGLSLVREVVQAHRGRVEVTTELGSGSTFRVYLPAARMEETGGNPS